MKPAGSLALLALLQAVLGVWTLLLVVPVPLGLAHQAGAVAVFYTAVYHLWLTTRVNAPEKSHATASA